MRVTPSFGGFAPLDLVITLAPTEADKALFECDAVTTEDDIEAARGLAVDENRVALR